MGPDGGAGGADDAGVAVVEGAADGVAGEPLPHAAPDNAARATVTRTTPRLIRMRT
jgi:hypothetical protein